MKTYWDSSALVEALHDANLLAQIAPDGVTRPHALSEVFCTLTKGVNFRYPAEDAANMLTDLAADLQFVELSAEETLQAIQSAKKQGVRGAWIHDLMHLWAAQKAGAARLKTLDKAGFSTIKTTLAIEAP